MKKNINLVSKDFKQTKKEKVKVFVAQPKWELHDWVPSGDLFFPQNKEKQIEYIKAFLSKSLEYDSDIIIFPELSILNNHLILIDEWSKEHNKIIIAGSQYSVNVSKKNISPIYINGTCIERQKTIAAGDEKSIISKENLDTGNDFIILENTSCGTLCIFICAEYLDQDLRYEVLKNYNIDILVVIALQKNSKEYYQRMDINIKENQDGIYIIYNNNFIEGISDGGSSIFALVNKSFTRTQKNSYDNQIYILENQYNYFLAEMDLKNKKSPISKNTDTQPNVIILNGYLDISKLISEDTFLTDLTTCYEYDSNTEYKSEMSWEQKYIKTINNLHQNIEHEILRLEYFLNQDLDSLMIREKIHETITEVLYEIKNIFDTLVGDVAVHIKLEEKRLDSETNTEKIYLRTLLREPSKSEKELQIRDNGKNELFQISEHTNINVLKETKINGNNIKINSAYNEVLFNPPNSWICNNLKKAREQNLYYSSSQNWDNYYESIAIFPIANRYESNNNIKNLKGLLIIDSKKIKCFEPELIKQLGGLIAHRINYIFSLEKVYEQYFN